MKILFLCDEDSKDNDLPQSFLATFRLFRLELELVLPIEKLYEGDNYSRGVELTCREPQMEHGRECVLPKYAHPGHLNQETDHAPNEGRESQ